MECWNSSYALSSEESTVTTNASHIRLGHVGLEGGLGSNVSIYTSASPFRAESGSSSNPPYVDLVGDHQDPPYVDLVGDHQDNLHSEDSIQVTYSAKTMIINPQKKKNYIMVKCPPIADSADLDDIKELILNSFPKESTKPQIDKMKFGYIEPGHGLKGKKEWLLDDNDVTRMVEVHTGKKNKEVVLWCYSGMQDKESRSRSVSPKPKPRSSKYDAHVSKISKVDEIYKKLDSIHGSKFTPEQKRAWAHMIELGKHDSHDFPPNKRFFFFKQGKDKEGKNHSTPENAPCTSTSAAIPLTTLPPGHRVGIRSECIDQLQKWHSLYKVGAVTKDQYEELQTSILSDIQNL